MNFDIEIIISAAIFFGDFVECRINLTLKPLQLSFVFRCLPYVFFDEMEGILLSTVNHKGERQKIWSGRNIWWKYVLRWGKLNSYLLNTEVYTSR